MRERGSTLTVVLIVVAAAAAVEGLLLYGLSRRVADLEARLAAAPAAPAGTPLALGEEVRALEQQVGDLAAMAARAEDASARAAARVEEVARAAEDTRQRILAGERPGATIPKGALEEAVAKAVEEKVGSLPQGGEWKPTMQQFREAFALTDDQADRAEEVFDAAKQDAYALLSLRRADGGSALDDLVAAFKDPADPEAAVQKVFLGLFTQKIPGRDEPYISEILRIKQKAQQGLEGILNSDQNKRLSRMNLDHLGVQTSYDPFAEYVRESVR